MSLKYLLLLLWLPISIFAAEIPVTDFARHAQYTEMKISPDGKYLAAIAIVQGERVLSLIRLSDRSGKNLHARSGREVLDFHWVNDHRVIYSVTLRLGGLVRPVATGELFGVNADGGSADVLFGFEAGPAISSATHIKQAQAERASASLLDYRSSDENSVLISVTPWNDGAHSAEGDYPSVYRMDVRHGTRTRIITAPMRNAEFVVDHDGVPRFAYGINAEFKGQVYYRRDGNSSWELIEEGKNDGSVRTPRRFSRDGKAVYFGCGVGKAAGLCSWDIEARKFSALSPPEDSDINGMVWSADRKDIVALRYEPGRPKLVVLDKQAPAVKILGTLMQKFGGEEVRIDSSTRDGSKLLVTVQSDVNPGEFYLFDSASNKLEFLAARRSWVKPEQMAAMEPFELKARDGLDLHGYLTRPLGKEQAKNLPLVVLPHGGPFQIRDYWQYDPEVQLLASRGYAVLQLNFRGSSGYGYAFYKAGQREWGGKMQDDLTDATRWAIAQGAADANRICIYGGSYGGYAALMGAEMEPDLYRCAIGYVGVYNLKYEGTHSDFAGSQWGTNYFKSMVGDNDAELMQRSPISHVDALKAAVMLVAGSEDQRVPIANAEQMRDALEKRHIAYEWLEKRGEGHGFYDDKNIAEFYEKMLAFLDKHIGAGAKIAAH
ncbi:S9 family peptidase [Pseudolysobacter antarcticus]|uniref:S9 family peptidase n=1 Tax=Pseudolysobacter antarcticus TaxID=2511995 RepID=A0A411HGZ0_9GAMM|nr:S9 family peptidase [Pseudolysobacter antarcticus]QBB69778.1 S9 family peptidase [Pseudolysobacter antarcticus]